MIDDFIINAVIAGSVMAITASVLGCFVVWRKMSYFGDSLAHSGLLGIALGMVYGLDINTGVIIVCLLFATMLLWLQSKKILSSDTLLGILAHAALSAGLVLLSLANISGVDLHGFLFGDILTVNTTDLWWIVGGGIVALSIVITHWQGLLLITINEDMAQAEGLNTIWFNIVFMLAMTITVAISINIIGVLLITSMLIIPAASARQFATSPEMMAALAVLLGLLALTGGILFSFNYDTPPGPTIVAASALLFFIVLPLSLILNKKG